MAVAMLARVLPRRGACGRSRTLSAATPKRCSSSVVEHSLGKGEVESSILSCSTIFLNKINRNGTDHSLFPGERTAKVPQNFRCLLGNIRGVSSLSVRLPCGVARSDRVAAPPFDHIEEANRARTDT
jgi:hypothetical protein